MNNNKLSLHENWEYVLNDYYNRGLVQEAGMSGVIQKGKDLLKKTPGLLKKAPGIKRIVQHRQFDKEDAKQGTGNNTSLGRRLFSTFTDLAHGTARFLNGYGWNSFNFDKADGSFFENPRDHRVESSKMRQQIIGAVSQVATCIYTLAAVKYFNYSRILSFVQTVDANGNVCKKYITYGMKKTIGDSTNAIILYNTKEMVEDKIQGKIQYELGQSINDDASMKKFKNFDWIRKIAAEVLFNANSPNVINISQVKTFLGNLKSQFDNIDTLINEHIMQNYKGKGMLRKIQADPYIKQMIQKKQQIGLNMLTQYKENIRKQCTSKVISRKSIDKTADVFPYLFKAKVIDTIIEKYYNIAQNSMVEALAKSLTPKPKRKTTP